MAEPIGEILVRVLDEVMDSATPLVPEVAMSEVLGMVSRMRAMAPAWTLAAQQCCTSPSGVNPRNNVAPRNPAQLSQVSRTTGFSPRLNSRSSPTNKNPKNSPSSTITTMFTATPA